MFRKSLFLFFLLLIPFFLYAQTTRENSSYFDEIELTYLNGQIMPHNLSIAYMTEEYTNSFSFKLIKHTDGSKLWHHLYHQPSIGYGFYYGTLGNDQVYGKSISLYSFFEGPVLNVK